MKRLLFVFNPHTGGGKLRGKLLDILNVFHEAGFEVDAHPTSGPGNAYEYTKTRATGYDQVVCCGGDGTLNEVVSGLMTLEKAPVLGYIPGGTTNDFAASLKLPRSNMLAAAKRAVCPKKVFCTDVGCFGDRHFNYVAAFGAFTDVSYKTPQRSKNLLGHFAYILDGVQHLGDIRPSHVKVQCESGDYEGDYLFGMVANSTSVAGFSFPNQQRVRLDDGVFEVLLVHYPQNMADLRELSAAALTKNVSSPLLTTLRIRQASFVADKETAWTLDGEFGGEPQAVDVYVRQKALPICI